MSISLQKVVQHVGADIADAQGLDDAKIITGISSPSKACESEITFISSPSYLKDLNGCEAAAVIIHPDLVDGIQIPALRHEQPYIAYALATALFASSRKTIGIHPTAVVGSSSDIGTNVNIEANAVLGDSVKIGDDVDIGANVSIGDGVSIGDRTILYPNVSIYAGASVGTDCIFHSGVVVGADGFGFARSPEGWIKIHQQGSVRIGNRVELGSNSSVDRGAIDDTVVEDGVKLDNLTQVGHNCHIGENVLTASQVGISGSTKVGKNAILGGQVGVAGHLEIAESVTVTGKGMITKSIKEKGVYSSGTSFSENRLWRKNAVRFHQLDALFKRVAILEKDHKKES